MTPRAKLSAAYDAHVRLHGRNSAVETVQAASGQLFASEVPNDKIAATIAALTGAAVTARASVGNLFGAVHANLTAMAGKPTAAGPDIPWRECMTEKSIEKCTPQRQNKFVSQRGCSKQPRLPEDRAE
jgi:hypothetical protein